ncbi:unnamed protein product [Dracunculus medinensis]|uniref:Bacterial surface antigen (D15) domain-containing protein n=1 Tax=Dracunculus medinensis TaxID=318479 RepID=A0A3P7PGL2_DRAME|nr:unnamed protein product [Dracunculus medinensis]
MNGSRQCFWGRGEAMNVSYSYSVKSDKSFGFTFMKPFLGWQKYSNISFSAYRDFAYLPWNLCNSKENGLHFQYSGQLWARKLFHNIKATMTWRTLCPSRETVFSIREYAGHTIKCSLENSVAFDTRNNRLLPSKGLLLRFAQEYAGLMGDATFVKHQFDFQAAAPLIFGTFLSASIQASVLTSLAGRSLHILDRLYLGGPYDVRGFNINSIGTRGNTSCLGGATSFAGVLHFYIPLKPPESLFAHAFLCTGCVASVHSKNRLSDLANFQRISGGIGLVLILGNIIRVEMNYVVPLKHSAGDSYTPGLQFGAGINFL